ncbi:hypothetical protein HY629_00145 [Candidatus Uhrbacteria bacterium]|nr:hypothetical protein [Candidatus Uhrbacteria bacterium]
MTLTWRGFGLTIIAFMAIIGAFFAGGGGGYSPAIKASAEEQQAALAEQKKEAPAKKEKTAAEKQADCEKRHPGSKYAPEVSRCVQKFTDAEEVRKLYPDLATLDCAGKKAGEKVETIIKGPGYTDLVRQKC